MISQLSLCILLMVSGCIGKASRAHFALMLNGQTTEISIEVLICVVMKHKQTLGVRYDTTTQECTSLPDSWFTNRTIIQGNVYFLKRMYGEMFEPTMDTGFLELPGQIGSGSSIAITFALKELKLILFRLYATTSPRFILFSMGVKYDFNITTYNTFKNGQWGRQEDSDLFVDYPNTTYVLEILLAETDYQIFLDGLSIYNFTKRYTEAPVYFKFKGKSSYCQQIQYFSDV